MQAAFDAHMNLLNHLVMLHMFTLIEVIHLMYYIKCINGKQSEYLLCCASVCGVKLNASVSEETQV